MQLSTSNNHKPLKRLRANDCSFEEVESGLALNSANSFDKEMFNSKYIKKNHK